MNIYRHSDAEEINITVVHDDRSYDCILITVLNDGKRKYAVLLPKEPEFVLNKKLLIYKLIENNDQTPQFENIFADEEYHYAVSMMNEVIGGSGYYELIEKYSKQFLEENNE